MGKRNPNDQLRTLRERIAERGWSLQPTTIDDRWLGYRIVGGNHDISIRPTREGFRQAFDLIRSSTPQAKQEEGWLFEKRDGNGRKMTDNPISKQSRKKQNRIKRDSQLEEFRQALLYLTDGQIAELITDWLLWFEDLEECRQLAVSLGASIALDEDECRIVQFDGHLREHVATLDAIEDLSGAAYIAFAEESRNGEWEEGAVLYGIESDHGLIVMDKINAYLRQICTNKATFLVHSRRRRLRPMK